MSKKVYKANMQINGGIRRLKRTLWLYLELQMRKQQNAFFFSLALSWFPLSPPFSWRPNWDEGSFSLDILAYSFNCGWRETSLENCTLDWSQIVSFLCPHLICLWEWIWYYSNGWKLLDYFEIHKCLDFCIIVNLETNVRINNHPLHYWSNSNGRWLEPLIFRV